MASEEWKIILSDETTGAGGREAPQAASSQRATKAQEDIASAQKQQAPIWANVGKLVAPLAGIAGVIAFVFQMIRRSKIFSTFMDSFLTILSAFVDIMLIPLIPIFAWVLKYLVKLLPVIMNFSEKVTNFLKDPWSGLKSIFAWMVELPAKIVKGLGSVFSAIGLGNLGDLFKGIAGHLKEAAGKLVPIFSDAVDKIRQIWGDKGLSTWEKIKQTAGAVWEAIKGFAKVAWDTVKTIWNTDIAPFIKDIWNNNIAPFLKGVWSDNIVPFLKDIWDRVITWLKGVWDHFVNKTLPEYWDKFIVWLKGVWNNTIFPAIINFFTNTLPKYLVDLFITLAKEIPKIMWEIIKGGAGIAGDIFGKIGGGIKDFFTGKWFGFQQGTNYVPQDMLAFLHKGERVVSAVENRQTQYSNTRTLSVNNIFNISGGSPLLPWQISRTVEDKVKFNMLRII